MFKAAKKAESATIGKVEEKIKSDMKKRKAAEDSITAGRYLV